METLINIAFFALFLSLASLAVILPICKAASKPMPKPPGMPPDDKVDVNCKLDSPTFTRKQRQALKDAGFTIVHPAPFDGLQPMQPEDKAATRQEIIDAVNR